MNLNTQDARPKESYRLIPLTQGQFAIVDTRDYKWLSQWKWMAHWNTYTGSFYATRGPWINGKQTTTYMHRVILGLNHGDARIGDHIKTGDTLNNRRNNLRIVSPSKSCMNRRIFRNNSSGCPGVVYEKERGWWRARISVNRKIVDLGRHATREAAITARQAAAEKFYGEYRHLG